MLCGWMLAFGPFNAYSARFFSLFCVAYAMLLKHVIKAISEVDFDRVAVPVVELRNLFDDAFNPIARDGVAMVEVGYDCKKPWPP